MIDSPPASPLRMYADLLGDIQEGVRGPGGLLYTVASWHILIKGLKWMENHLPLDLEGGDQVHSDLLDQIIAVGITIQQQANGEKVALSKEDHGTTMEEVQASLDWLRDKRSMWHGDVTAKRRAAVLESLFGHATA